MMCFNSSLTKTSQQAMLEATFFYIEQNCLLCWEVISQAAYYPYEQKEVTDILYESIWIFYAITQNITLYYPDIVKHSQSCDTSVLNSHTLYRIEKIQILLRKLRGLLCTFSFLDPNQKCILLLQNLLLQEILNTNFSKSFNNNAPPPWINPIVSKKRYDKNNASNK
ncbi:hypothetical protein [Bacillus thuringiensis]|uniref:Uncharacterized protein n=1 Tax=Bacillus thuringiensis Bt18247 TaxID=1423143 RepID=A0A9W3SZW8_BACTU|nr:hypothetical protein [Bacillus thuringiensis]AOM14234.1 hypothetical protein BTI247_59020 [Bacillus thuringiensis Bt18247]MBG9523732.1 hypothetical protein [Bacillus thuringiensis]